MISINLQIIFQILQEAYQIQQQKINIRYKMLAINYLFRMLIFIQRIQSLSLIVQQIILIKIINLLQKAKTMYKGTPYINKIIKRRDQERIMDQHQNNLCHARPLTGTLEHDQVVINNKKRQMLKEDRFTQIQRENRILLQKISSIMSKPGTSKVSRTKTSSKLNKSLNSDLRKKQMQNIEVQNAKLLKRLQQKKSDYQTEKFRISWKKQKNVIKNLSNYPFVISDRKKKRSSVSAIGGSLHYRVNQKFNATQYPRNAQNKGLELCRMKFIDGVSFLITVRLSKDTLQIIGDSKDKKDIKVIEIDKKQATQFIQQECDGKIEKIFDRLRFDRVDQVLYLVGKDIDIDDIKAEEDNKDYNNQRDDNPQFDISVHEEEQKPNSNHIMRIQKSNKNLENQKKKLWVPRQNKFEAEEHQPVKNQSQLDQEKNQEPKVVITKNKSSQKGFILDESQQKQENKQEYKQEKQQQADKQVDLKQLKQQVKEQKESQKQQKQPTIKVQVNDQKEPQIIQDNKVDDKVEESNGQKSNLIDNEQLKNQQRSGKQLNKQEEQLYEEQNFDNNEKQKEEIQVTDNIMEKANEKVDGKKSNEDYSDDLDQAKEQVVAQEPKQPDVDPEYQQQIQEEDNKEKLPNEDPEEAIKN